MGTCLKGMGGFRKELLLKIIMRFHRRSFTFKEASALPGFDRATFMNLYHDRLIKKASKGLPLRYSIISRSVEDIRKQRPTFQVDNNCPTSEFAVRELNYDVRKKVIQSIK